MSRRLHLVVGFFVIFVTLAGAVALYGADAAGPATPVALAATASPATAPAEDQLVTQLKAGALLPNAIWLETLDISNATCGWNVPQAGKSVGGNPLKLRGVTYQHGVGVHAVSKMLIDLKGAATRFVALVGLDDESEPAGSPGFEVWVDGKQVVTIPVQTKKNPACLVSVDLKGAKELLLIVNDGGNGPDCDHGDWAGAMLQLDPAAKEKPVTLEVPDGCVPEPPKEPGYHNVKFRWDNDGKLYKGKYSVFVPRSYAKDPAAKLPVILFLHGAGECGPDVNLLTVHGPPMLSKNDKTWQETSPFMVISPQLQGNFGWGDEKGAQYAMAVVDHVATLFPVDPDRLYATGLSLGGIGSWRVAVSYPDRFAAIVPTCARHLDPVDVSVQKIRNLPVWVATGDVDGDFTSGTRKMVNALRQLDAPVRLTVFPDGGHGIWVDMYANQMFYDWLLSQRRGQPGPRLASGLPPWWPEPNADGTMPNPAPAPAKPGAAPAATQPALPAFSIGQFTEELGRFAPGWTVADLGTGPIRPGLREQWQGRRDVLVTCPRDAKTACRLLRTIDVPANPAPATQPGAAPPKARKTKLHLEVARHQPAGEWQLIVRAQDKELLNKRIDKDSANKGWVTFDVDLSKFAGQSIPVQLLTAPTGWIGEAGYWAQIKVVTQ